MQRITIDAQGTMKGAQNPTLAIRRMAQGQAAQILHMRGTIPLNVVRPAHQPLQATQPVTVRSFGEGYLSAGNGRPVASNAQDMITDLFARTSGILLAAQHALAILGVQPAMGVSVDSFPMELIMSYSYGPDDYVALQATSDLNARVDHLSYVVHGVDAINRALVAAAKAVNMLANAVGAHPVRVEGPGETVTLAAVGLPDPARYALGDVVTGAAFDQLQPYAPSYAHELNKLATAYMSAARPPLDLPVLAV